MAIRPYMWHTETKTITKMATRGLFHQPEKRSVECEAKDHNWKRIKELVYNTWISVRAQGEHSAYATPSEKWGHDPREECVSGGVQTVLNKPILLSKKTSIKMAFTQHSWVKTDKSLKPTSQDGDPSF